MSCNLKNLSIRELMAAYEGPSPEGDDYASYYFTEVAHELGSRGTAPVREFLLEKLRGEDANLVSGAIYGLGLFENSKSWLSERIVGFLEDDRPAVVAETIRALTEVDYRLPMQQIEGLYVHSDPVVVGAALEMLARLHPKEAVPRLLDALNHAHCIVRESACDELDDLDVIEAVPNIRRLLNDPHEDVRQAARTAIENLLSG